MKHIYDFVSGPLLYGSTFMLGLLLGVLCDAHLLLDPKILKLLVLGVIALLFSGIGGILGGYVMYFIKNAAKLSTMIVYRYSKIVVFNCMDHK